MYRALNVFVFLFLLTGPSLPAQILLNLRADTTAEPPNLKVRLAVTNQGNEEAHDLQINLRSGPELTLPGQSVLLPGAVYTADLNLNIAGKLPGKYPLYATVGYADRNGYQFSAILCAAYFIGQDTASEIFGALSTEPLVDRSRMQLRLKNLAPQQRDFALTVFTPRELSADYERNLKLKPTEERKIPIPIRNFSARPGSNYPIYVVAEYDREGRHFTSVIVSTIQTLAETGFFARYRSWLLGAAALFVMLGIIVAAVRLARHA